MTDAELMARLAEMEVEERTLRNAGHTKMADKLARDNAKLRRKVERFLSGKDARRAAADKQFDDLLAPLVAGLERRLADKAGGHG